LGGRAPADDEDDQARVRAAIGQLWQSR
jgi:hypothetical protein